MAKVRRLAISAARESMAGYLEIGGGQVNAPPARR